jgi:hypothetical protein
MGLIPNWKALFGTPSGDDSGQSKDIPSGSEGSIQYEGIRAGDGLVWLTVAIWGDLRDFGEKDTRVIDEWFERIVAAARKENIGHSRLILRAAHLFVEVESGMRYLLVLNEDDDDKTVQRIELERVAV